MILFKVLFCDLSFVSSGTPADLCHLCINDEIIAVDGVKVTELNFSQWKNKMSSSLQTGSLTMDLRRYGNKGRTIADIPDGHTLEQNIVL